MITAERVRELLRLDHDSGHFHWIASRGGWGADRIAGSVRDDGYRRIGIDGTQYLAHDLVWLVTYGQRPTFRIAHGNGVLDDNRAENLVRRLALTTGSRNTSGYRGVSRLRSNGKWLATIKVNRRSRYLGRYESPEAAHAAYVAAHVDRLKSLPAI